LAKRGVPPFGKGEVRRDSAKNGCRYYYETIISVSFPALFVHGRAYASAGYVSAVKIL
jgi:hypothetical protein